MNQSFLLALNTPPFFVHIPFDYRLWKKWHCNTNWIVVMDYETVYVVRHHESHIMSEKKYFSFWQIWIFHILSFKLIYNLPYIIVRKMQQKSDRKLKSCMAQFSFPSVFLAFWAFMISDFIRVTWWRTTYICLDQSVQIPSDLVQVVTKK